MTSNAQPRPVVAGDEITILKSGVTVPSGNFLLAGRVATRGDVITVTQQQLDGSRNRLGDLIGVALAGDPDAQISKWGEQRFALGRLDLDPWTRGDPSWAEAREEARRAAHAETDPDRRAAALKAVRDRFGPAEPTSRTITQPRESYWEKQAEKQRRERKEAGLRHRNRSITTSPDEGARP